MNIAVFAKRTTFHKGYGGLETQNKTLLEGLVKRGHSVTLFSPCWELPAKTLVDNGITYVFVDCVYRMGPVFGFFGTLQKNNWINRSTEEFEKLHLLSKFDLVLGQSSTALGVIKRKAEFKVKVVSISHGTIIGEYKSFLAGMSLPKDSVALLKNTGFTLKNFFRRQRDFVHGSDKVVCVSNYVRNSLIEETFAPEDKFIVIHNGINPFTLGTFAEGTRGTKCLYVGRIIKDKGVEDLIAIFKDIRFKDYSIDIIGDGEHFGELDRAVTSDKSLRERVRLTGSLPYEEVVTNYYKNPDYGVFLFPTKRVEGFPMVLVESLFAGLPPISYDIGGVSDAIDDSSNGYLVALNDFEVFKQKLLNLLTDSNLRMGFSNKCIEKANKQFTLDGMVTSYEKVFKEIIK